MASTRNIALNFIAVKTANFSYMVYRKKLARDQDSVPGTRNLPDDCLSAPATSVERDRYEVSLQPKEGFEATQMGAWINQGLTDEVLPRVQKADRSTDAELSSERKFTREIAFFLARHEEVREVMWLRAYGLQVLSRFGFLCRVALRVPRDSTIPDKLRLELSLTHKNGRVNDDLYLDQYQKPRDPWRRTSFVPAASSMIAEPSARIPPPLSMISRRHNMLLPWVKPNPIASAQYCQRASKALRKAHSSSAQRFRGRERAHDNRLGMLSGFQAHRA